MIQRSETRSRDRRKASDGLSKRKAPYHLVGGGEIVRSLGKPKAASNVAGRGVAPSFELLDEYQYYEPISSIEVFRFQNEEEANSFSLDGKELNAKAVQRDDEWVRYYSRVGELGIESIREAGRQLESPLLIDAEYMCGYNWAETH